MSAKPDKLARMGIVHAAPTGGNDEVAEAMRLYDAALDAQDDGDGTLHFRVALEAYLTQLLQDEYWRGVRREGPPVQPTVTEPTEPVGVLINGPASGSTTTKHVLRIPEAAPVQPTEYKVRPNWNENVDRMFDKFEKAHPPVQPAEPK